MILKHKNIVVPAIICLIFGIIYASISLVNHYFFRTFAMDLGVFNNAMYDFAHLRLNQCTLLLQNTSANFFADHFSLIVPLLSPFYYLFGSYTLLIFQILFILAGGIGIYKFISTSCKNPYLPYILMVQFYLTWGIYSALSFDFHENVLASMAVPWFLYFYRKNDLKFSLVFFFIILFSKENMALWLLFIIFGTLLIKEFKQTKYKFLPYILIGISLSYFIVVAMVIIPALNINRQSFSHVQVYQMLGKTMPEIFGFIFTKPQQAFTLMFINPTVEQGYNGIKIETFFIFLVSGGFAVIYRPQYLIMLLPIFAQKMFSYNAAMWGINNQYSIEFVPLITLAIYDWIRQLEHNKLLASSISFALITALVTFITLEDRVSLGYKKVNSVFYSASHYKSSFDPKKTHEYLTKIPANEKVSAMTVLAPHLYNRRDIYYFPIIADARYIALVPLSPHIWPMLKKDLIHKTDSLKNSLDWKVEIDAPELILFKRVVNLELIK